MMIKKRFIYFKWNPSNLYIQIIFLLGQLQLIVESGFEFQKLGLLAYKFDICIYFVDKYEFWKKIK